MEEKARKYCSLYKMQPTLALTYVYRELSQNLINGMCGLLLDWCLYAADYDDAFIDFLIPVNYEQLYSFTFELLSREMHDTLVVSRAVRLLKNQKAPMKNLTSLLQNLDKCKQSEDVLLLIAVIYSRLGKDFDCIRYCKKLSTEMEDLNVLRSRLHLMSAADLELLKLVILSHQEKENVGISNNGFAKDDKIESKHSRENISVKASISSSIDLQEAEIAETSFQSDDRSTDDLFKEVVDALSRIKDLDATLPDVISFHVKAGRTYIALWMLLQHFKENSTIPCLNEIVVQELQETLLHVVRELKEYCVKEKNADKNSCELQETSSERAIMYCKIANILDDVDIESGILQIDCLYQCGKIKEALALGKELLNSDKQRDEVLLAMSYCSVAEGKYYSAMDDINTAINMTSDRPILVCVRGFVSVLAGNVNRGLTDITSASRNDISMAISRFRNLKLVDQEKIKDHISQHVMNCLNADLLRKPNDSDDSERLNLGPSHHAFENKVHQLRCVCEFLTKVYSRDLSIHLLYVEVLVATQRYGDAQELLVYLIRRVPDDPFPMIHLANLRMRFGAYVAAVQDFRIIMRAIGSAKFAEYIVQLPLEDRQEIARVHRQHGFRFLQDEKAYHDAIECFNVAIIALGGTATGLILVRGFCYTNLGDFELALNDFLSVIEREPDNTAAMIGRAIVYSVFDNETECTKDLSKILKDKKDSALKVLQKVPISCVRVFASLLKNRVQFILDDEKGAIDDVKLELGGMYAEFLYAVFGNSSVYGTLYAQYLLVSGKHEAAMIEVEKVLRTVPDDDVALSQKAFLLAKSSRTQECISVMRALSETKADILEGYLKRLTIRERNELKTNALKEAKDRIEAKENAAAIRWYNLALVIAGKKDLEVLRGRFECFLDDGMLEEALADLSTVIEAKPSYSDYCIRAKLHDSLGKEKQAWNDYIRAIDLDEERTVNLLNEQSIAKHVLCLFCMAANGAFVRERYQEVLRLCDFGLKLDPNHKELKQLRYRTKCVINRCTIQ